MFVSVAGDWARSNEDGDGKVHGLAAVLAGGGGGGDEDVAAGGELEGTCIASSTCISLAIVIIIVIIFFFVDTLPCTFIREHAHKQCGRCVDQRTEGLCQLCTSRPAKKAITASSSRKLCSKAACLKMSIETVERRLSL